MSIVAGVDDLFFMAKILDAARRTGVAVEGLPVAKVQERTSQAAAEAVILDLNSVAAVDTVRELKRDPATREIRVLGFVSHVDSNTVSAARDAGCDLVLARSAFSKGLPDLLRQLASRSDGAPAEKTESQL